MRKALAAVVLGSLVLLVNPATASAHTDLKSSSPTNGSVTSTPPKNIVLTFSEPVDLQEAQLLGATGQIIPSSAKIAGTVLTITPTKALTAGASVAQWKVKSDDGHVISGAIAFVVGKNVKQSPTTAMKTMPVIATTLNGNRVGQLILTMTTASKSGEIQWTHAGLTGAITWRASGNGKKVTSTGVLPFAGTWNMNATLVGKGGTVLVTTGTVNLV
jgi:methionine-rich copper-binding protein CopC